MKRYEVRLSPEALTEAEVIDRWWRENRPSAPDLFRDELAAALERLSVVPGAGAPYQRSSIAELRRVFLPRTRYHVYYVVDDAVAVVRVHAVWHSARGQRPEW